MALFPTPGSALTLASTLLLTGCENLLPGGQQSPPPAVVVAIDSAPPVPPPSPPPPPPAEEPPRKAATGPEAEAAFRAMGQSLRGLVATEQGFYAENGTYSADLERLGFRPRGETRVEFLRANKDGWAGRATHPALPGRDCVTFAGAGPAPETRHHKRRGREGVVVCDTDAPPRARRSPPSPVDSAPAGGDTTNALDAVNPMVQMRVDLRKLATAQAAYFGTQGTYSRRVETLPLQYGWQRGVSVTLLNADQYSWAARATHEARPGKTCVVWFGSPLRRPATRAEQKVPERAGIPVCDD